MLTLIKKLDPVEAKVTVEELLEMIKRSKASLGDQFNKWDATTFKHGIFYCGKCRSDIYHITNKQVLTACRYSDNPPEGRR